jgi:hypothetical protein
MEGGLGGQIWGVGVRVTRLGLTILLVLSSGKKGSARESSHYS